jgi:hypothetical protein
VSSIPAAWKSARKDLIGRTLFEIGVLRGKNPYNAAFNGKSGYLTVALVVGLVK